MTDEPRYKNFVQSAKGGSLHIPFDDEDGWNRPLCGVKAECWNVYGLTADEYMEQRRRWKRCGNCYWTIGFHQADAVVKVESWRWADDPR